MQVKKPFLAKALPYAALSCLILDEIQSTYLSYITLGTEAKATQNNLLMSGFVVSLVAGYVEMFLIWQLFKMGELMSNLGQWITDQYNGTEIESIKPFYFGTQKLAALTGFLWFTQIAAFMYSMYSDVNEAKSIHTLADNNPLPNKAFWPLFYLTEFGSGTLLNLMNSYAMIRKIMEHMQKNAGYQVQTLLGCSLGAIGLLFTIIDSLGDVFSDWADNASQCVGFLSLPVVIGSLLSVIGDMTNYFAISQHHTYQKVGDRLAGSMKSQPQKPLFTNNRMKVLGIVFFTALTVAFVVDEYIEYIGLAALAAEAIKKNCPLPLSKGAYKALVISNMGIGLVDALAENISVALGGLKTAKATFKKALGDRPILFVEQSSRTTPLLSIHIEKQGESAHTTSPNL